MNHNESVSKRQSIEWKHTYASVKKKVSVAVISKEDDIDSLLQYQRIHHYWFLMKKMHQ